MWYVLISISNRIQNSTSTVRGCITTLREIRDCIADESRCSTCPVVKTGACNTYDFPSIRRKCVHCRGGKECEKQIADAASAAKASRYCEDPADTCVSVNNRASYTMTCSADLTRRESLFCEEFPTSCSKCTTDNCNHVIPKQPDPVPCTGSIMANTNLAIVSVVTLFKWLEM